MPQDATCPTCTHPFPVTEARQAFTVACPKCDTDMTVEFRKPAAAPEAGQPPYDLLVRKGALPGAVAPPAAPKKKPSDDDDEPTRKGGSALIVLLSGGLGLLFVVGGLGLTAWFLFAYVDTTATVSNTNNSNTNNSNNNNSNNPNPNPNNPNPNKGNNNPPNKGNNNPNLGPGPGPFVPPAPPKPNDTFELRPVGGSPQAITPPPYDLSTPQEIALPGPAAAVSVGGNGRYIVMHIPSQNQLVCFDASKGQVFPGPEATGPGNHLLAAGQNRLAVLAPNNILRVYDLPGLQRRYDASGPPLSHHAASIAMGSATNGPLLACNPFGEVVLMDIGADVAVTVEGSKGNIGGDMTTPVRASANGKLFVRGGFGNGSKSVLATEWARKWKATNSEVCNSYPSPDGRYAFGYGMIVRDSGQIVGSRAGGPGNGVWYVPAVSGAHFLRLSETKDAGKQAVSISVHGNHLNPQTEKAVTLGVLPETDGLVNWFFGNSVPLDQHLFLIPEAKMLVVLSAKKDTLTMRKVDIK